MMHKPALLALCLALIPCLSHAAAPEVEAALSDALTFSTYQGGTLRPEQIPAEEWQNYFVIDTRHQEAYAQGHIPDAHHIEWRDILAQQDQLPSDQSLLLYCHTGSLAAQAALALKIVTGRDDIYILGGGYEGWQDKGGFQAYQRATAAGK
jgi:rhodanese-related sulfurtransferase